MIAKEKRILNFMAHGICILLILVFSTPNSFSQAEVFEFNEMDPMDDQQEKISFTARMAYYITAENDHQVRLDLFKRDDNVIIPVRDVIVNLFLNERSEIGMMGSAASDKDGKVVIPLGNRFHQIRDTVSELHFMARIINDEVYEDKEVEIMVQKANIHIELIEEDQFRQVVIELMEVDEFGDEFPVPYEEIKIYIKRMFGHLPIGGNFTLTDDDGLVIIDFPNDIPGDENGQLQLVVKLEENDMFGNMEFIRELDWGIPVTMRDEANTRALWGTRDNAPIWLLFLANGILAAVWLTIFYIFFQLIKIRRAGSIA